MKTFFSTSIALLVCCVLHGADPASPAFGGERIGVPPLSLAEIIAKNAVTTKPFQFGTGLPAYSAVENRPNLSPNLVPRPPSDLAQREASRSVRSPRVSRASGMPIIEPSDIVDYKLTIVAPDPSIDFKMILKEPAPKSLPDPAK